MPAAVDDCFVVFVREEVSPNGIPDLVERELVRCPSYEQAEWVRRECGSSRRKCIIRFLGPSGGGD